MNLDDGDGHFKANADFIAAASPSAVIALLDEIPKCSHCDNVATCFGRYEGHGPVEHACDDCCAHGNEDGWCAPFAGVGEVVTRFMLGTEKAENERDEWKSKAEAAEADARMLMEHLHEAQACVTRVCLQRDRALIRTEAAEADAIALRKITLEQRGKWEEWHAACVAAEAKAEAAEARVRELEAERDARPEITAEDAAELVRLDYEICHDSYESADAALRVDAALRAHARKAVK